MELVAEHLVVAANGGRLLARKQGPEPTLGGAPLLPGHAAPTDVAAEEQADVERILREVREERPGRDFSLADLKLVRPAPRRPGHWVEGEHSSSGMTY